MTFNYSVGGSSWKNGIYSRQEIIELTKNKKDDFTDKELLLKVGELLTTAINQSRMLKDIRAEAQSIGALGNLYAITSQNQHAQKLTEQAVLLAESLPAPDIAYRLQWQLGRILAVNNAKNPSVAIAAYRQSINHLKTLRNDLNASDADLQFSFRDSVEPVYRELVSLLLQGDEKVATANIESARDLIESLQVAELENFLDAFGVPSVRIADLGVDRMFGEIERTRHVAFQTA